MKCTDKIYKYIIDHSHDFTKDDILNQKGPTAQEIGDALGIFA